MVVKTSTGMMFEIIKNNKNAFDLHNFESKYIEECFNMYQFIVGDLSNNLLRLKGFSTNPKSKNYFKNIDLYIYESCAFRCPVFILRRIKSEEEYEQLYKENKPVVSDEEPTFVLEKENFDRESLVLESTPSQKPKIIININRINKIPGGTLPSSLAELKQEENNKNNYGKNNFRQNSNDNKRDSVMKNNNNNVKNSNQGKNNNSNQNNSKNIGKHINQNTEGKNSKFVQSNNTDVETNSKSENFKSNKKRYNKNYNKKNNNKKKETNM